MELNIDAIFGGSDKPRIGTQVLRTVRGGVQKGVVTAHRGDRISVEFASGDQRTFGPPFDGLKFNEDTAFVDVDQKKLDDILTKVIAANV